MLNVLALQDEQWLVKEMSPVEPKMLELDISEKHKFMQQLNRWNFFYKKRDADTFQAAFRTPVRNLTEFKFFNIHTRLVV